MTWRAAIAGALERGLYWPMRLLPSGAASAIGAWLGRRVLPGLFPVGTARARAAVERLQPGLDADAAVAAWANIAASFAEMPRLLRFPREGRIEISGAEHLPAGRPAIVAGLHTGNPELIGLALSMLGHPPDGIAQRQPSAFRERVVTALRLGYGARPIPAERDAMRAALRALRSAPGAVLLFYVDEHAGGVVRGPTLGRFAPAANGNMALAARLARLTGAAILPAYAERLDGRARFRVTFLPPVVLPGRADRVGDARAIDAAIDPVVRALLPQWHHLVLLREEAPRLAGSSADFHPQAIPRPGELL